MRTLTIALSAVALLTIPALASPKGPTDKPIVVAEGTGVSVRIGDRDRGMRRHRNRERIVIVHRHREGDRGRHHRRDHD